MVLDLSIDPVLLERHGFALTWNGIGTALALICGMWLALRRAEHAGIAPNTACVLALAVLAGGVVGSRIVHVLGHWSYYAAMPHELLIFTDGGGSLAGAVLCGSVALLIAGRARGVPAQTLTDATPPLLIGIGLHALGTFVAGSSWGVPTGGMWGVIYWHPRALLPPTLLSVPLHPFPIYQALLALASLLLLVFRRFGSNRAIGPLAVGTVAIGQAWIASFAGSVSALERYAWLLIGIGSFTVVLRDMDTLVGSRVQASKREVRG